MVSVDPVATLPLEQIAALCRAFGVMELSVFGSALREDHRPDSDLDLLVEFGPDARIGFLELAELQFALEDVVGRPVDLVPKSGLKAVIRDEVLASSRIIYAA